MPTRGSGDTSAAIGVLDSGVGGLSVLREVRRAMPYEHLIYVADSGFAPYGTRDDTYITGRVQAVAAFLINQGVKAIVVACNTATGIAVDALRRQYALPIIAIEPAVKPAVSLSARGRIGVMATSRTLTSERFARLLDSYARGVSVTAQACPGLVECVERGELDTPATAALVDVSVAPLRAAGVDVIVLGCTHYPLLLPLIAAAAGPGITIIDPAEAVARELARRLSAEGLTTTSETPGSEQFFTTGDLGRIDTILSALWPGASAARLMA